MSTKHKMKKNKLSNPKEMTVNYVKHAMLDEKLVVVNSQQSFDLNFLFYCDEDI